MEVDLFELLCKVLDHNLFAQVDWARKSYYFNKLRVGHREAFHSHAMTRTNGRGQLLLLRQNPLIQELLSLSAEKQSSRTAAAACFPLYKTAAFSFLYRRGEKGRALLS